MSTDADRYACPQCSEIHERVCARIAADRISSLEAELAEARGALVIAMTTNTNLQSYIAKHDDEMRKVFAERDAAVAEAAAMRLHLIEAAESFDKFSSVLFDVDETASCCAHGAARLAREHAGTAGRDLAARVPLLEAVARAAERIAGPRLPSAGDWDMLRLKLAALDEKSGTDGANG